ncbi:MAG: alpha/beta hydrolase fold domain-containing protein, partial [Bacteroidota bacterium]
MPSLRARLVSAVLRRFVKNHNRHGVAVQRNRRANRKRPSRWDASPCIATAEELGGVPSHRLTPPNADDSLVLMYLHGGAFIAGPVVLHWWFLSKLCKLTRAIGYLPDYRKAPEHHCTEGFADVERAYLAIRERHPNSRVVVLGDSAGGNLTLVLSLLLRDKGLPLPNRIAMLAPVMDATFSNPEVEKVAPFDPMLALNGVSGAARLWARDVPLDD